MDVRATLSTASGLGLTSDVAFLVDADEELGAIHVALRRLKETPGPEAQAFAEKLGRLEETLEARRAGIAAALERLEKSQEGVETALVAAAFCKGVDMRDPKRPRVVAKSPKAGAARARPASEDAEQKANLAILASKGCESPVRLWSTVQSVDLASQMSSSGVAAHVVELDLDRPTAAIRDKLSAALRQHVDEARALRKVADPKPEDRDAQATARIALRRDVQKDLEVERRACPQSLDASAHIVGGKPEPRRVTVTVRPKWPPALAPFATGTAFGSGFVVRWRNARGDLETRIITNNHVMGGAFEADIFPGDPTLAGAASTNGDAKGWSSVLIESNPYDDVAILRLEPSAQTAFPQGLTFRHAPAREQENVTATGFPGVGTRPSFQVSRGIVSNATFGAEKADADPASSYVQHTAAIDPGNSGGPLLDGDGQLLGMNTLKVIGRENMGLAIPVGRIERAMMHAEERPTFDVKHAEASCNAVVASLAAGRPSFAAMSRFGLAVFEATEHEERTSQASRERERVEGHSGSPVDEARLRAYGAVRAKVEADGGVRPFETCRDVKELPASGGADLAGPTYAATMRTRQGKCELTFAAEHGVLRLVQIR
jgi:S1-C subfamily serine protease